ncbi:methyl-accepting chemotaxis protein [Alicyclobacillus herbarius]|uniref:methyl-accepting chemotaxis protein n=1 Tax=Alicyclobacillus herbarius TaxID=122960 RepID=UPI00040E287F|nr:methyl-accepting chemotaxis protein [Alicyclobacillus herbarius]
MVGEHLQSEDLYGDRVARTSSQVPFFRQIRGEVTLYWIGASIGAIVFDLVMWRTMEPTLTGWLSWTFGSIIVGIVVLAILVQLRLRVLLRPIGLLHEEMQRLAQGDVGDRELAISGRTDLAMVVEALRQAKGNMRDILEHLKAASVHLTESAEALGESARQTTFASEQTAASVSDIQERMQVQRQEILETELRMRETVEAVERIQRLGEMALRLSQTSRGKVDAGKAEMQQTAERMLAMRQQAKDMTVQAESMSAHAKQVMEITQWIQEIADQTQLLALNAAIEAARAGEEVRGFTVVADEVRRLAAQAKSASDRVHTVVTEMGSQAAASLSAAQSVASAVEEGQRAVESAAETFLSMVEDLTQQDSYVEEIEAAATEIGVRAQTVKQHMTDLVATAEQQTELVETVAAASEEQLAMMEEVAAGAEDVRGMARTLQQLADRFSWRRT